jgi:hypothetical protein
VGWYKAYAAFMAVMSFVYIIGGFLLLQYAGVIVANAPEMSLTELKIRAVVLLIIGIVLFIAYVVALILPKSPGAWIYHIVMIAIGLTSCCLWRTTENTTEFVSATFQDILARVVDRHHKTGAIFSVKAKQDAPEVSVSLSFSIEAVPQHNEVIITLSENLGKRQRIYEQYRLKVDKATQRELDNWARYKQMVEDNRKEREKAQSERIQKLTGGKLKFGMSTQEVIAIKGQPLPEQRPRLRAYDGFTMIYPDMKLEFVDSRLDDVRLTQE